MPRGRLGRHSYASTAQAQLCLVLPYSGRHSYAVLYDAATSGLQARLRQEGLAVGADAVGYHVRSPRFKEQSGVLSQGVARLLFLCTTVPHSPSFRTVTNTGGGCGAEPVEYTVHGTQYRCT